MVTCMQDITGQQVRRDSFLKFSFLLHTLNVPFHPMLFWGDKVARSAGRILPPLGERSSQDTDW